MTEFDNTSSSKQVKTYEDGLDAGESRGRHEGYQDGLNQGRNECYLQNQADAAEQQHKATLEARRIFFDTAFPQSQKIQDEEKQFDPKAEVSKADTNLKAFIADVQVMTPNELLATEKELDSHYAQKQDAWKQHHGWFESKPVSPMAIQRGNTGSITEIDFPQLRYVIPVTYWNSQVEDTRIKQLGSVVQNADNAQIRSVALKALADELGSLKLPQLAQMEALKSAQ